MLFHMYFNWPHTSNIQSKHRSIIAEGILPGMMRARMLDLRVEQSDVIVLVFAGLCPTYLPVPQRRIHPVRHVTTVPACTRLANIWARMLNITGEIHENCLDKPRARLLVDSRYHDALVLHFRTQWIHAR